MRIRYSIIQNLDWSNKAVGKTKVFQPPFRASEDNCNFYKTLKRTPLVYSTANTCSEQLEAQAYLTSCFTSLLDMKLEL